MWKVFCYRGAEGFYRSSSSHLNQQNFPLEKRVGDIKGKEKDMKRKKETKETEERKKGEQTFEDSYQTFNFLRFQKDFQGRDEEAMCSQGRGREQGLHRSRREHYLFSTNVLLIVSIAPKAAGKTFRTLRVTSPINQAEIGDKPHNGCSPYSFQSLLLVPNVIFSFRGI